MVICVQGSACFSQANVGSILAPMGPSRSEAQVLLRRDKMASVGEITDESGGLIDGRGGLCYASRVASKTGYKI